MFLIARRPEDASIVLFRNCEIVNFAVSVIVTRYLRVEGFNHHFVPPEPIDPNYLYELGFSDLWLPWFRDIVTSQHMGFVLEKQSFEEYFSNIVSGFNREDVIENGEPGQGLIGISASNLEANFSNTKSIYEECHYVLYKLAIEQLERLPKTIKEKARSVERPLVDLNPSDFWIGSEEIRRELEYLWFVYKLTPSLKCYHLIDFNRLILKRDIPKKIHKSLKKIRKSQLIQYYFVNYYTNFFRTVDSSVVVGLEPYHFGKTEFPFPSLKKILSDSVRAKDKAYGGSRGEYGIADF